MTEPMIYTSKGNLPVSSLTYSTRWEDSSSATVFIEEYRLGDELVKSSVHALSKHGVTGESSVGGMN